MRSVWTQLNRHLSQANWAGYSPGVLQWENDANKREVVLKKVKDLLPEECEVNWKLVEGWAPPGRIPPKFKIYDGINQLGGHWPIPVDNSFWYPILMENGDYTGRKLLRPAFTSWFFSILLHLFANRYYERFGEPTPVGRAPYDETLKIPGQQNEVSGSEFLLTILSSLRSRGAVVLPNDMTEHEQGNPSYDYDIDYLESQMRGADFERYMTRLDEEMSLGLFTPILLMRTADVGSYNLGVGHMQVYLWMMNAINDDRKMYIDKYILSRMVDFNFSEKAPRAEIKFRKLGNTDATLVQSVLAAMITKGRVEPNIPELGQLAGMTLNEINETIAPQQPDDGGSGDNGTDMGSEGGSQQKSADPADSVRSVIKDVANRVRPQVENAMRDGRFNGDLKISMGYKRKLTDTLRANGINQANEVADKLYARMDGWTTDQVSVVQYDSPDQFMDRFVTVFDAQFGDVLNGR
jgi:hypothetical protein